MERGFPRGLLGALGGAAGMLPLLPAVRGLAVRLLPPPRLPGAERLASDVKAAAYLESAVIVLAIPAAAVLFGRVLPRLLASRTPADPLVAELPGAAFGVSFLLWRFGADPAVALALGVSASAALGAAVLVSGGNSKSLSVLAAANRDALAFVVAACAAWDLSWRSARLEGAALQAGAITVMAFLFALALAVALLPGRLRKKT